VINIFKKLLPQTLKSKLIIALFSIGFLPYLFILLYTHSLGEEKILNDAITMHHTQMLQTKKQIQNQLYHIQKEIAFLASLDIMNDMIVGDIDKRIAQILIQKQKDLALDMDFYAIDMKYRVVASSKLSQNKFTNISKLKKAINNKKVYFFTDKSIIFFTPIISILQNNQQVGYLLSIYKLSNLSKFTLNKREIRSMLYNRTTKQQIGAVYSDEVLNIKGDEGEYLTKKYLVLYKQFNGILSEWSLVYMSKKSVALAFLDDFILFVWWLFGLGFIVIAFVSWWISRRILQPIAKLSNATQSIITTKDYTTQVDIKSQGEISQLADDFNIMIQETNNAFKVLEEENRLRLLRFIQLINIFNSLIQTQSEEECIKLAVRELEILMPKQSFIFSKKYPSTKEIMMLYIKNFKRESCDFYGVIMLDKNQEIDIDTKKFYNSIATMIMLQLDQIRLIEETKEVSRSKSDFISYISHELRTPLHTILTSTQYLIAYEDLTHSQQKKIVTMESSANHLLGMINDILDLAQIEAGKVTVTPTTQSSDNIELLTQEVITMLEVLSEDAPLTLVNRIKTPIKVTVDIKLLKQIIINLISNAIKFTDKGSIDCEIEASTTKLYIIIQDSGIGLEPQEIDSLFENFSQIQHTNSSQQKGSGLGLVISRKLAQLFGGDIKISSKGRGFGVKAIIEIKSISNL